MPEPADRSFLRRYRWPIAIVVAVLAIVVVAPFVYINFIKAEPAERLSLDDVTPDTSEPADDAAVEGIAGTWSTTDQSVVQYRVKEVLFGQDAEATGTADGVEGTAEITGTGVTSAVTSVEVEVDMTTFESDESNRDGQFQGRIMDTASFPTATFSLTEPIDLGSEPADGEEVTLTATGDLTMHGVTQTVTFDLTAERTGSTFAANATIPIAFADYDIDDPSGGPASVGDVGELALLLVFTR
jgi:polyisoprenoid-binding protein YceI